MAVRKQIHLDEDVASRLDSTVGGGNQSAYVSRAVRNQLLADELRALAATPDEWAADTDHTAEGILFGRAS